MKGKYDIAMCKKTLVSEVNHVVVSDQCLARCSLFYAFDGTDDRRLSVIRLSVCL